LAENFVGTLKNALKSAQQDAGTLKKKLAQFLIIYRIIWRRHVDQMRAIDTPATDSMPTATATVVNTTQRSGAAEALPAAATASSSSTD